MTIDQAIRYFRDAEEAGYFHLTVEELESMTEAEIIGAAEALGNKGDYLSQEEDNV